jgi:hypothetical protein
MARQRMAMSCPNSAGAFRRIVTRAANIQWQNPRCAYTIQVPSTLMK